MSRDAEINKLFNEYLQDPRVDYKSSPRSKRPLLDFEKPSSKLSYYDLWTKAKDMPEEYLWPSKIMRGYLRRR